MSGHHRLNTTLPFIALLVVLLATFFIYRSGLNGPFVFDDGPNVVNNYHLKIQHLSYQGLKEAALSGQSGSLKRPVSMLSFALDYYLERDSTSPFPESYPFKLTNLIIHLLNGIALYLLTKRLAEASKEIQSPSQTPHHAGWLALAVASLWLLHPLALTSVLYVVQRMASLSALFAFLSLYAFVAGRMRLYRGTRGGIPMILFSILVLAPLSMLSKENGALIPFFMLAAEATLFRLKTSTVAPRKFVIAFFLLFAALPAAAASLFLITHLNWLTGGYSIRDFDLYERVLTESRAIWFYIRLIFLPNNALMGIYHDDFAVSHGLLDPKSTLLALIGIAGLAYASWLSRRRFPLVSFGILFFLIGQSMESTVLALELVHEYRNYLPMYGLLLAACSLLLEPSYSKGTLKYRLALVILVIPLIGALTWIRADTWTTRYDLWSTEVRHHPDSPRANIEMGDYIADEAQFEPVKFQANYLIAKEHYQRATALDPNDVNGLFGLINLARVFQLPLPDNEWRPQLTQRLAHARLASNVNTRLTGAANCLVQGHCPINMAQVASLYQAALSNPTLVGNRRAMILASYAQFLDKAANRNQEAIAAIQEAIDLAPSEIAYRVYLVQLLIATKRPEAALIQIKRARQADSTGAWTRILSEQAKSIGNNQGSPR